MFQHDADYVMMLHICLAFRIYTLNSSSQYSKFEGAFTGVPNAIQISLVMYNKGSLIYK